MLFIEKQVAHHLGVLAREFRSGELKEDDVENTDETHFVIDIDNGRTIGFSGQEEVKYAGAVSGGEGMTLVVRISGGRDAKIEAPFMVFKNANRSSPIRGVPDDVCGVSYRSGLKGWMDTKVMPWLLEKKVISALPFERKRILFVDNCSGHNQTSDLMAATEKINTEIRYFEPNQTDFVLPCDSFVIQKFKSEWSVLWERYKMDMIMAGKWAESSGKIPNPGKSFFLRLAMSAINAVNKQRGNDGLSYARKAMIVTEMALNTNGQWEERQLLPKLQQIIHKPREYFEGKQVEME